MIGFWLRDSRVSYRAALRLGLGDTLDAAQGVPRARTRQGGCWKDRCGLLTLVGVVCLGALAPAVAQTAHSGGAISTLGSGFSFPYSVALDSSGNIYIADYGNNAVKEIVAAGGYTTINTLGSGFTP